MIDEVFDISNFNIFSDDENYYFFRTLEDVDIESIKNIDEILFEQLKDTLKIDPYKFIKSSDIIKQNKKIIELVTSIDSRLKAYAK